jgi:P-type E1-E2 ATPase
VASLERYSKHPLARAILASATKAGMQIPEATEVSEPPGQGLRGTAAGHQVQVTSRNKLIAQHIPGADQLPPLAGGLECVVAIDERYAAALRFRDAPRAESLSFVKHLGPKHQFRKVMIVSGDREAEVRYLAEQVGITDIHAQKSPEEKLAIVRAETAAAKTQQFRPLVLARVIRYPLVREAASHSADTSHATVAEAGSAAERGSGGGRAVASGE